MLQGSFGWIALFAFLAATVNALGILVVFRYREQAEKLMPYLMCFAAGVLISTPLMIALPAALERDPRSGFMALGGFLFMFFSNKVIRHYTHEEALAFGITAAQGIAVHSFVDGIVYAVTFEVSVLVGVLSAGGLVAHEFAEGVITFLILVRGSEQKSSHGLRFPDSIPYHTSRGLCGLPLYKTPEWWHPGVAARIRVWRAHICLCLAPAPGGKGA